MLELLFLLLPVSVAYGWVMGKYSAKKEIEQQQNNLSKTLTSSVTLLLKNKEEQALDDLISFLDDSPTSVENYLAMAQLFRKKGELDKAISIHEGLLRSDANFEPAEIDNIQLELGQDFLTGGMLERALKQLSGLLNTSKANESLSLILHIYEQTREWQNGIDAYLKVSSAEVNEENRKLVSHFYCELADQSDNLKNKKQLFKRALKVNSNCTRSLVSMAQLYLVNNQKQQSRELIVQVLDKEPEFAPALFNIAPECFVDEFEQAAWLFWLIKEKHIKSVTAHNQLADVILKEKGIEPARNYIIEHLQEVPSVRGFAKLLEIEQQLVPTAQFEQLQFLVNKYISMKPNYECNSCGFSTNHFSWRCPACNSWQTIKPLTGLDGI